MSKSSRQNRLIRIESLEPMILMTAAGLDLPTDGNDVLIADDPGQQLDGLQGHDIMIAFAGDNRLNAGDDHDTVIKVHGNNLLDGGSGRDTLVYWNGNRDEFAVTDSGDGVIRIQGRQWTDLVRNFETVQFDDGTFQISDLLPQVDSEDEITGHDASEPDDAPEQEADEQPAEPNENPIAHDDTYYLNVNERVSANLRRNDIDPDGPEDRLRYALHTPPPAGVVNVFEDGSFEYESPRNFVGEIPFRYLVKDSRGGSDIGRVLVSIHDYEDTISPEDLLTPDDFDSDPLTGD